MKLVAHREDLGAGFYTVNVSHVDDKNVTKPLTIEEADALIKFVEGAPDMFSACKDALETIEYVKSYVENGGLSAEDDCIDSIQLLKQAIERVKP